MSNNHDDGFDLFLGLFLGLLGGGLAGILYAPKPGKEIQKDVKSFIDTLPEEVNEGWSRSKGRYKEIVGRTRQEIENQLEQRSQRKQAIRMAEAKLREEQEAGNYDY